MATSNHSAPRSAVRWAGGRGRAHPLIMGRAPARLPQPHRHPSTATPRAASPRRSIFLPSGPPPASLGGARLFQAFANRPIPERLNVIIPSLTRFYGPQARRGWRETCRLALRSRHILPRKSAKEIHPVPDLGGIFTFDVIAHQSRVCCRHSSRLGDFLGLPSERFPSREALQELAYRSSRILVCNFTNGSKSRLESERFSDRPIDASIKIFLRRKIPDPYRHGSCGWI